MPSPLQQQSVRRKIIYTALILVLFFTTLIFRTNSAWGIESQAAELELREIDRGEVELTGKALQLTLSGARGGAVCFLWWTATKKQMRNEWNELELLVRTLTKLQPHFITPWMFQSWNLAYNVSVESDRNRDKYFYITRGIELLGEGERRNKNNPDLRFYLGFYNQHKIGLSDEANTFRCFYQMSCIKPTELDQVCTKARDASNNEIVDMEKFEQFCRKHPMLVRRLRETLKKSTPTEVVEFLNDNRKVPSRYEDKPNTPGGDVDLKVADQQFPLLPPAAESGNRRVGNPDEPDFDNFTTARDWYAYSLEPLPPPSKELGPTPPPFDARKYRLPRYMAANIFRGYPSRGQTYVAEYVEREGWFETEGWRISDGWFPDDKFRDGSDAKVGADIPWALKAWEEARNMWKEHGIKNGLYMELEDEENLKKAAMKFGAAAGIRPPAFPNVLPKELRGKPEMEAGFKFYQQLYWYDHYRTLTNYPYFFFKAQVEADPGTIGARRTLFQADEYRKAGERAPALKAYRDGLTKWREILLSNPGFRRDEVVQEDSYEIAARYAELAIDEHGRRFKEFLLLQDYLTRQAWRPFASPGLWIPYSYFARDIRPNVITPLDGKDDKGEPIIGAGPISTVRERLKLPILTTRPSPEMMTEMMQQNGMPGTKPARMPQPLPVPGGK